MGGSIWGIFPYPCRIYLETRGLSGSVKRRLGLEIVFFDLGEKGLAVDSENFCSPAPVSLLRMKNESDVFLFDVFEGFELPAA